MPQIRCPNCGITINLETRKETDYEMIVNALRKSPKTFTDLLKFTNLPRKTLSLRLAALRESGVILKDGGYRLNGANHLNHGDEKMPLFESQTIKKPIFFTRRNVLVTMMLALLSVTIAFSVSGMLFYSPPPSSPPEPPYIGTFQMKLRIYSAQDLYAWQVMINYDSSELVFVNAVEGDFFAEVNAPGNTVFAYDADPKRPGTLFLGGSLTGEISGVNGNGTLATITFGFKSNDYKSPYIVYNDPFDTYLSNSNLSSTMGVIKLEN